MKFKHYDYKIMEALDEKSRLTFSEIGKKVTLSKETVRYRMQLMEKSDVILNYSVLFNPAFDKLHFFRIYYVLERTTPEIEEDVFKFWQSKKNSCYIEQYEGIYNLCVTLLVPNNQVLENTTNEFRKKYESHISETMICLLSEIRYYQLLTSKFITKIKSYGGEAVPVRDELDNKIINLLTQNSRLSIVEIANKLKTTGRKVKYRLKLLESNNTLLHYGMIINSKSINKSRFIIHLNLKDVKTRYLIEEYFSQKKVLRKSVHEIGLFNLSCELLINSLQEFRDLLDDFKRNFNMTYSYFETSFVISQEYNGMFIAKSS
jgi:DNA-binding Lrp family transcriptional regulator